VGEHKNNGRQQKSRQRACFLFLKEIVYQYIVYRAARIPQIIRAPTAKPGAIRNSFLSTSNAFGRKPLLFSIVLMIHMPRIQKINTNPILSKKGIS
jgi:hypothetical protein